MNGINESHFIPNILPKEKLAFLKMLEKFDPQLLLILKEEVTQGNKISSVAEHVSADRMVVILSQPFKKKYETIGTKFETSINPHDSGDFYSTHHPEPFTLIAPLK